MKINSASFGVFITIIVFMVGSFGITVGHYADGWIFWYFPLLVISAMAGFAVAMKDEKL